MCQQELHGDGTQIERKPLADYIEGGCKAA